MQQFELSKLLPVLKSGERTFLMLPNQTELIMEDGTIFHVRSFFTGNSEMGQVLDALETEKIFRTTGSGI